tara:strand:+ start:561 stop:695 length:135 start_codon:yes stop_codon:yes gene_type:complete
MGHQTSVSFKDKGQLSLIQKYNQSSKTIQTGYFVKKITSNFNNN